MTVLARAGGRERRPLSMPRGRLARTHGRYVGSLFSSNRTSHHLETGGQPGGREAAAVTRQTPSDSTAE